MAHDARVRALLLLRRAAEAEARAGVARAQAEVTAAEAAWANEDARTLEARRRLRGAEAGRDEWLASGTARRAAAAARLDEHLGVCRADFAAAEASEGAARARLAALGRLVDKARADLERAIRGREAAVAEERRSRSRAQRLRARRDDTAADDAGLGAPRRR